MSPPFTDGTSELRRESSDLPKAVWLASKLPAPAPAALGTHALCEQAFVFSEVKSLCVLWHLSLNCGTQLYKAVGPKHNPEWPFWKGFCFFSLSLKRWWTRTGYPHKVGLDLYLRPYTKINSKWIEELNMKAKTIKLLQENTGLNLHGFVSGTGFLDTTQKAQAARQIN